jgi:hypothetical protein
MVQAIEVVFNPWPSDAGSLSLVLVLLLLPGCLWAIWNTWRGKSRIIRLAWTFLAGFVLCFCLHITSAIITIKHPYHDYPLMPKSIFIYLLWPGWIISGEPWPFFRVWQEIIAAAINGVFYSLVIFCLLTISKEWRETARMRKEAKSQRP